MRRASLFLALLALVVVTGGTWAESSSCELTWSQGDRIELTTPSPGLLSLRVFRTDASIDSGTGLVIDAVTSPRRAVAFARPAGRQSLQRLGDPDWMAAAILPALDDAADRLCSPEGRKVQADHLADYLANTIVRSIEAP